MLTKNMIDRAEPRACSYTLWDDQLGGFGCKVFPSGKRSFVLRYRLPGSRARHEPTIGPYGALSLPEARKRASQMLLELRAGRDPQAGRKAAEQAAAALTAAQLVEHYSQALRNGTAATKRLHGRVASDGYRNDSLLQVKRFAAELGNLAADTVTRTEVSRLLLRYMLQPSVHRRLHGAIHRMYAWGRAQGLVAATPTADIETTSPAPRERSLSLEELAQVWRAAETLEPLYSDTVKLLILTGQRKSEVAGMRWGEIDLARNLWTLPAARTKARRQHVLPLPALAVAVLQRRRAALRHTPAADDLVLPTVGREGRNIAPISGWNWLKRELDHASGIAAWRLHDFRRSLVTISAEHDADIAVLDSDAQPCQQCHSRRRHRHLPAGHADRTDAADHGAMGYAAARGAVYG